MCRMNGGVGPGAWGIQMGGVDGKFCDIISSIVVVGKVMRLALDLFWFNIGFGHVQVLPLQGTVRVEPMPGRGFISGSSWKNFSIEFDLGFGVGVLEPLHFG